RPMTRTPRRSGKAIHRYSSSPSPATTTTTIVHPQAGARKMRASRVGIATAAVASLARSTGAFPFLLLLGGEAEAPLALLEVFQRANELRLPESGPEGLGDVELGVGDLPEEEVRHAHLAAGADQQVGIGKVVRAEVGGHGALVDRLGVEPAVADGAG